MSMLVLAALLLDLLVGDPRRLPHPVVLMGALIKTGEGLIRQLAGSPGTLRLGGVLLVIVLCTLAYGVTWGLIWLASLLHPWLGVAVHLWLLATTLAVKSLYQHAVAVAQPLARGDLATARQKVALIVGRDCDNLNHQEVTRAAVETVAENTVDGIVSPLFYAFIGGAPLAMAYKAVNTLDSMIGHRHEVYAYLGWAAARLDDLANYLPARLAGVCYALLSPITPGGFTATVRAMWYDAPAHPSPNSGIPEAAVAGALGVQLGGTNYYQGKPSYRARLGQAKYPLTYQHIYQALRLTWGVTALIALAGVLIGYLFAG
ncbi:adenosylcobinamide-phosphate synthase CbiB [Desulfotomaculum varum]